MANEVGIKAIARNAPLEAVRTGSLHGISDLAHFSSEDLVHLKAGTEVEIASLCLR